MKHFSNILRPMFIMILVSFVAATVNAQNTFYYNAYKTWTSDLERKANEGTNVMAIVSLGSCYDRADGVALDRQKAFNLFKKAADMGDVLAKYNLGLYYSRGYCGKADNIIAIQLFEQALRVDKKFGPAYLTLAQIYERGGAGVDVNIDKAFATWLQLANLGDSYGQYNVGRYHWQGIGRPRDISKAKEYYLLSAKQGNLMAMDNLSSCLLEEKNYNDAYYWLQKAYDKGAKYVCHNLADMYYWGNGIAKSYEKAYAIFEEGAETNPRCKYRLSVMLMNGEGVQKDPQKAITLLSEAAEAGIDKAQYQMGVYFYSGDFVTQSYEKAVNYFKLALESKFLLDDAKGDLCKRLSACYRFGRGVEANETLADKYSRMAASFGNSDAVKIQQWLNPSPHK